MHILTRQNNIKQMLTSDQPKIRTISTGENKLLHGDVKIGDLLKVEIIDSLQKQVKLLLPDGTIFEAQLDQFLDVYIGQQVTLEVKDIIGKQIHMEITVADNKEQPSENSDIKNILKQLNIPVTEDSQEAVKFLMQKMLPITKENIRQIEFGLKTSQLPIESLLSMLENEIPVTPNTLTQMQAYENGEIKLQGQLQSIIESILTNDNAAFLEQVYTTLSLSKDQIEQNTLEQGAPGQKVLNEQSELPKQPQQVDNTVLDKQSAVQENETPRVTVPKDTIREPLYHKDIDIIKQEISDLFKELFFIRPEQLKNKTDLKLYKINELYKDIYELTDTLEKIENQTSQKQNTNLYTDVKSNIEFLTFVSKYDTVMHIPLLIQNQYKHGELYIFNKKKTEKKNYHEASMLISLETVALGTVEAYIKKYNKQISCQFKTDDRNIENIIKENIYLLKVNLKDKGYDLTSVTYMPNSQTFTIKEDAPNDIKIGRYRFDTKA